MMVGGEDWRVRATAARSLNCMGSVVSRWFGCCVRPAYRWFVLGVGLFALFLALGRATGLIPAPPGATWQHSPWALAALGLLFCAFHLLAWRTGSRKVAPPTPGQLDARRREIEQILDRPIAGVDDLRALLEAEYGTEGRDWNSTSVQRLVAWAKEQNAELWFYTADAERWENLCGECGVALVRDGRVVSWETWSES